MRTWILAKGSSLIMGTLLGLLAMGVWMSVQPTPCALAAGECPVGSSSIFSDTVGIQGGTAFTITLDAAPTAAQTITFPDDTSEVVLTSTVQILSNKTLTSPIINTPTITTPSITGNVALDGDLNFTGAQQITTTAGDLTLNPSGNIVASSNSITGIGNAGSQLLADAWTMTSANTQILGLSTEGVAAPAYINLTIPVAGTGIEYFRFIQGAGNGDVDNQKYTIHYEGNLGLFRLRSESVGPVSTAGTIIEIADDTNDVKFAGGISTDGAGAPTSGILSTTIDATTDFTIGGLVITDGLITEDSLRLTGILRVDGQLRHANGLVGTPSISFTNDTDTGFYWVSADRFKLVGNGGPIWDFQPAQISMTDGIVLHLGASYIQVQEMAAPGAGAANRVRIYAVVDGGTLTDLAAVFQDGTVDIFAQEVTEPGDAVVAAPDETVGSLVILRPHPGTVQVVIRVPGYGDWVLSEKEFHDAGKLSWVQGAADVLPADWLVETAAERKTRNDLEAAALTG